MGVEHLLRYKGKSCVCPCMHGQGLTLYSIWHCIGNTTVLHQQRNSFFKTSSLLPSSAYVQRYQGHHSGHSVATHHKPGSWPEGSQLKAVGHPLLPGESGSRQTSHQPSDHLPAAGCLQLVARCKSTGELSVFEVRPGLKTIVAGEL